MNDYKFTCEMCKFKCKYNSGWLEHISSKKHQHQGTPTTYKCNIIKVLNMVFMVEEVLPFKLINLIGKKEH